MAKLDWTKTGVRSSDPGGVVGVGDYGILTDQQAGRKGNQRVRRKKTKEKALTVASKGRSPKASLAQPAKVQRTNKTSKSDIKKPSGLKSGGGLTIPELIARAKAKVDRLKAEIRNEERKLNKIREQLKSAEYQLLVAKDTPRRSAAGRALHVAKRCAEKVSTPSAIA